MTTDIDDGGCQMRNSSVVCSNRGSCICGQCLCNLNQHGEQVPLSKEQPHSIIVSRTLAHAQFSIQVYSGTYCECDDGNCPIGENGLVCSGQGSCKCSKCVCASGFVGDSCGCSTDEATKFKQFEPPSIHCGGILNGDCGVLVMNAGQMP